METLLKKFIPPHCPNPKCSFHNEFSPNWSYKKSGYYWRQYHSIRVQRFTCLACNRSFSTQTFSIDYWQKHPKMGEKLFFKIVGGMANRQIAKDLRVSPATIDRQISRLARHCLLYHCGMIEGLRPPSEIVVDGFESFEFSQYFPMHHNLAVEKENDFFWYFTDSPLRRKGRMTPHQKKRRQELENLLGRPDPKAIEKDMRELIQVTLKDAKSAIIYSDCHPAYPRAIKQVNCEINHRKTPGTDHRDANNNLWSINLLDLIARHCSSNHKRETLAWSKRRQGSAERLLVLLVWRNYVKRRREKERFSPTPAMEKGLTGRPLFPEQILTGRLFRTQMELPPRWSKYYDRAIETKALPVNRKHELRYAY